MRTAHSARALVLVAVLAACSSSADPDPSASDAPPTTSPPITAAPTTVVATTVLPTTTLPPLQSGVHTIEVDGTEREYRLHVPSSAGPGSPLVLVFHGYTDSAEGIEEYSRMSEVADEQGFVVAYPQGTLDSAGMAFFDVGYDFHKERVDDLGFARALQAFLVDRLGLDAQSVFVTGMSNGGDMSYLLACSGEPWVAAIAPVAGSMMQDIADACAPAKRMSVMEIHGTDDQVTLWDGDPTNQYGWGAYLPQMDAMQLWVDKNALESQTEEPVPTLAYFSPTGSAKMLRWTTAADGTEVRMVRIDGGAHVWGGIETSQMVWEFFAGVN